MIKNSHAPWPYPRHLDFVKNVRKAASKWFQNQGYSTNPKYPYILAEWKDWHNNIILPAVAQFIRETSGRQREDGNNFPLHKYIHHGLSSQAMLFNLVGPMLVTWNYEPLKRLIERKGLYWPGADSGAILEYEDRSVFDEGQGQPTSIDLAITSQDGTPQIFIEAKFVEQEFGGCSVFANGDCDGRNPARNHDLCYLHHIGRKYWSLMHKYGIDQEQIGTDSICVMAPHYQFFREFLFALEKGGIFVLLSDERSPVFRCTGPKGERGIMPFLTDLLPSKLRHKVAMISIQELIAEIRITEGNHWVGDFSDKYGLRQ